MEKSTFIVYKNLDIDGLTDNQLGQLFRAMLNYANDKKVVIMDAEIKGMWRGIKKEMDMNDQRYKDTCERNRQNALKRWNTEKNDSTEDIQVIREPVEEIERPKPKKPKPERHKYGKYGHVMLTDEQYKYLIGKHGEDKTLSAIQEVDDYCEQNGKSYKNYSLVMEKWGYRAAKEHGNRSGGFDADAYLDSIIEGKSNDGTGSW